MTEDILVRTESNLKDRLADYIITNYDMELIQKERKAYITLNQEEHLELFDRSGNVNKAIHDSVCNAIVKYEGMKYANEKYLSDNPYNNNVEALYVKWQLSRNYGLVKVDNINVFWTCTLNNKSGQIGGNKK